MTTEVMQTKALTTGYSRHRQHIMVSTELELTLHSGELTCLLGPNGAGKSTLLRTMAGLQQPLSGQIRLMGQDIQRIPPSERAKRLSVVLTQRPEGGMLNGYALIALGRQPYTGWSGRLTQQDREVVQWAVAAVDATDIAHLPLSEMSDGQRQKIMIARALAQEPAVMFLDEPTAFLDLPRRVEVVRLLRKLAHETGRAILLTTHDLDLALHTADRLWLMDEHSAVHAGLPEELVVNGTFEQVFNSTGVPFDALNGGFRVYENGRANVHVTGDELHAIWTRRALQRMGFSVTDSEDAALEIRVNGDKGDVAWRVDLPHRQVTANSLTEVIDLLKPL